MHAFLNGAALGFLIAAPVGPIGLLCISRTIRSGWTIGFVSGLGAATADAAYACVAALGISAAALASHALMTWFHIAGAVLLFAMGIRELRSRPGDPARLPQTASPFRAFAGTAGLTLLNPATIFSFLAIFAALSRPGPPTVSGTAMLVGGVFAGSACWWLILATATASIRRFMSPTVVRRIGFVSAMCLMGFAVYALVSA